MLVGREEETRRLEALLARALEGHSGSVVIRGEAGMGKTALLAFARERANGFGVSSTVGVESEADLPFAALVGVCRSLLPYVQRIAPSQRAALEAALGLADGRAFDRFGAYVAVLSLLGAAAEAEPRLVLVDDLQWMDTSSAEAVLFTARRLGADRVAVVAATRAGDDAHLDLHGLAEMRLGGLDRTAALAVLRMRYDGGELPDDIAEQIIEATAGVPLALVEVPAMLTRAQRRGVEPIPDPFPVGDAIQRAYRRSIDSLPPDCREALLLLAADEAGAVEPVQAVLASRGLTMTVLEPAEESGLIQITDGRAEFRHPLLRAAVYRRAPGPARRAAHAALAVACAAHDGDARAWHLAAAAVEPDESVASALEASATAAHQRTAYASAARALERAAELTPDAERRARRLLAAAESASLAGRAERALRSLDAAIALTSDPLLRADIELVRGRILYVHGGDVPGHALLLAGARRIEPLDPDRAAAMLIEGSWAAVAVAELDVALDAADRAAELAGDLDSDLGLAAGLARAVTLMLRGRTAEAREVLDRAKPVIASAETLPPTISANPIIGALYFAIEDYAFAEVLLGRFLGAARAMAAPELLPHLLGCLADLEFRIGRWAAGYAHATEAVHVATTIRQEGAYPYALVQLARIEAAMGRHQARSHAREAEVVAARRGHPSTRPYALAAVGLLELGVGHIEAAIVELEEVDRTMRQWGVGDPYVVQWMPDLVEAYSRAGRQSEMRQLLDRLHEQAQRTEGLWARAVAARGEALIADDFDEHFARALALHDRTPTPFERARTELCYGERLRRSGRRAESRTHLRAALETFERLGAAPWRDRAATELGVSVEHVARGEHGLERLSPQELQVALLVAEGATNREVAAALFVTMKTVEFHLRNIYRKLSIRSRTELARAVAGGVVEPTKPAYPA